MKNIKLNNPLLFPNNMHCLLVGEDHLIIECAEVLIKKKYSIVGIISPAKQVREWAEKNKISFFHSFDDAKTILNKIKIHYLFSIVNSKIIPSRILAKVESLAVNYHHSPLPRYAGVNATSWAILNNEKTHGVTWHILTDVIDGGDILKQILFPIEEHETALSLNLKCYQYALSLFEELATELLTKPPQQIAQSPSERTYYGLSHKPKSNGWINWDSKGEEIERFFRAFYIGAHDNKLSLLKFHLSADAYIINELKLSNIASNHPPGTITEINALHWKISTASKDVIISQILTLDGKDCSLEELANEHHIDRLSTLQSPTTHDARIFETMSTELFNYEAYWIKKIENFKSAGIPFLNTNNSKTINNKSFELIQTIKLTDALLTRIEEVCGQRGHVLTCFLTIWLIYLYRLGNKTNLGIALSYSELYQEKYVINFFSKAVPFSVKFDDQMHFNEAFDLIIKELDVIKNKKTYLMDIFSRYQSIANSPTIVPISVVLEDIEPIDIKNLNTQIVLKISSLNNQLEWYLANGDGKNDSNLLVFVNNCSQHFYTAMMGIMETQNPAIKNLPYFPSHERQMLLEVWNKTKKNYPREKSIYVLLDEQFSKTQANTALQYEDMSITYHELKTKVDNLSRYLKNNLLITSMESVIVHTERSVEWVVTLLAILKIGAIYIPVVNNTPIKRLKTIVSDSNARYILCSKALIGKIETKLGANICLFDIEQQIEPAPCNFHPEIEHSVSSKDIAYILYTSGTTGKPKGGGNKTL